MSPVARGSFDIELRPAPPELERRVTRHEFSKTFHGELEGGGAGVMLSCGSPQSGAAGYVAIETVHGRLDDRSGNFVLQQFGMMSAGSQTLHYEIVPGSGEGELTGIAGTLHLMIEADGTHRYRLEYSLPNCPLSDSR